MAFTIGSRMRSGVGGSRCLTSGGRARAYGVARHARDSVRTRAYCAHAYGRKAPCWQVSLRQARGSVRSLQFASRLRTQRARHFVIPTEVGIQARTRIASVKPSNRALLVNYFSIEE